MRHLLLGTVVAAVLSPIDVGAQSWGYGARMVAVGARVRVDIADRVTRSPIDRASTIQQARGIISAIGPDTLYLQPADSVGAIAIPRILIQDLRVSLGPPSRWTSGREVGAYGAVILALIFQGEAVNRDHRFGSSLRAATIGAGAGFVIGALIGVLHPYERWRFALLPD